MKKPLTSRRYLKTINRQVNFKKKTKRLPMFSAIVIGKRNIGPKQPNSGLRKCIKIQSRKEGKVLYAFCPGDGAIEFIEEHDVVSIVGVGTKGGRPKGDIPAINLMVAKVNGVCLKSLISGKREKKVR
jgi:small subunit ribosomal protein S12